MGAKRQKKEKERNEVIIGQNLMDMYNLRNINMI